MNRLLFCYVALLLLAGCAPGTCEQTVLPSSVVSPALIPAQALPTAPLDGYWYVQLGSPEQDAYRRIQQAASDFRLDAPLPLLHPLTRAQAEQVYFALQHDLPALDWMADPFAGQTGGLLEFACLSSRYPFDADALRVRQRETEYAAKKLLAQIPPGLSVTARTIQTHDALLRAISYRDARRPEEGSLYAGLVEGRGSCDSYSRSMQYLLQMQGIPCLYIQGISVRGVPHAWNLARMEDGWYYIDTTWDEPAPGKEYLYHDYLLVDEELFYQEHMPTQDVSAFPKASGRDCSYYRSTGRYADADSSDPAKALAEGFAPGLRELTAPDPSKPVFLELRLYGSPEDCARWQRAFCSDVFAVLRELNLLLEREDFPFSVVQTGRTEYNYNSTTRVLTLFARVEPRS